jgi:hypothetical protein
MIHPKIVAGVRNLAVKIKLVRSRLLAQHPVRNGILLVLGGTVLLALVVGESIFGYYYFQYRHPISHEHE